MVTPDGYTLNMKENLESSRSIHLILGVQLSIVLLFSVSSSWSESVLKSTQNNELTPVSVIAQAYADSQSNIQVTQKGVITRILADDTVGDRHQRLIVRLSNNQTLLIAHNVDLSPRVPNPIVGKTLGFFGEYEWNKDGGVVHWTHKDPSGKHIAGWLEYEGKRYSYFDLAVTPIICKYNIVPTLGNNSFTSTSNKPSFDLQGRALFAKSTTLYSGYYVIPGNHTRHVLIHSNIPNVQF
jgi:hypothetical protein